MANEFMSMIWWVISACILGCFISAFFAGWMRLSRRLFLIPYVLITLTYLYGFSVFNEINVTSILADNWIWGVLAGGLLSLFLVRTVRAQPASRQINGASLVLDLTWAGLVYGMLDALYLNVMPVMAVWLGFSQFGWSETLTGKIVIAAAALSASLLVTLAYHLGYPEFRNKSVGLVLVGNGLITLAFLLSGSPMGAILSHTIMHLAAVWQGAETTIQLPPHSMNSARVNSNR